MYRTVFALVAIGAVVMVAALAVAWRVKMSDQAAIEHASKPAAAATVQPPPPAEAHTQAPPSVPIEIVPPTFDVARIGADGRAVIAGRAAPGAKVVLLDGGKEIARGAADARGEWVLLVQEPPLSPGHHELRVVQHIEGRAPLTSEQVVVAIVPEPSDKQADTLVMISPPGGGASTLVQPPSAGTPKSNDLQLSTLDYDEHGNVTITGSAASGAAVRAYIDDEVMAEGTTGADNRWQLSSAKPIDAGKHVLRLDRLGKDGKPEARLELSFERIVPPAATATDNRRLTIVRGDCLWNIARAHYGEGWRYTVIFEANKTQIRDPNLIYPGQIFAIPKLN